MGFSNVLFFSLSLFFKQPVIYPVLGSVLYILGWNSPGAFKVYISFNDSWWICILMSLLRRKLQHSLGEFYTRQQTSLELWSYIYIYIYIIIFIYIYIYIIWVLINWPWGSCGVFFANYCLYANYMPWRQKLGLISNSVVSVQNNVWYILGTQKTLLSGWHVSLHFQTHFWKMLGYQDQRLVCTTCHYSTSETNPPSPKPLTLLIPKLCLILVSSS